MPRTLLASAGVTIALLVGLLARANEGEAGPDAAAQAHPQATQLSFSFPGWRGAESIVQGLVTVAPASMTPSVSRSGVSTLTALVHGEVRRGDDVIDRFRYRFEAPAAEAGTASLPWAFQRPLAPDRYRVVLRVEDPNTGLLGAFETDLVVPRRGPSNPSRDRPTAAHRAFAEANRGIAHGETVVDLVLPHGEVLTGFLRFEATVQGDQVARVTFALDGRTVHTQKAPPYRFEFDLGRLPQRRTLRVTAFDGDGHELASDERLLNGSPHRFSVRLIEPIAGADHAYGLRARVAAVVPEGATLDHVEIYHDETRVATLYQPPYVQPITLPEASAVTLVRAVGHLRDGTTADDTVLVNGPDHADVINVDFIELYTTVLDRRRRPVLGLTADDFTILEDGQRQILQRFDIVRDLPIHATILLDVSASMAPRLDAAREAAVRFFTSTVRPDGKDRVAAITFNDRPRIAAPFGNDVKRFAEGIANAKAERGTAFFDSLLYALFYAHGLAGQRAIVLLSDGVDENSNFDLDDTLEYARRAEVTLYAIGLDLPSGGKGVDRRVLTKLAEETGGRSFFLEDIRQLTAVYDTIRNELSARYLLAYQSNSENTRGRFRRVEVKVKGKGEAKTIRGYYP